MPQKAMQPESTLRGPLAGFRPKVSRFFVIEGLDGAGTTTQTALVAERLREAGAEVHPTREPTRGPIGGLLDQHVFGRTTFNEYTVALAFSADRLDHLVTEIVPKLASGFWVVSDRYYLSTLAYQGMKIAVSDEIADPAYINRDELDEAFDWIWEMNRFALRPHATIFLDVPPDVCAARTARSRYSREAYDTWPTPVLVSAVYHYAIQYAKRRGDQIFTMNGHDRKAVVIADDIADILLQLSPGGRGFSEFGLTEDELPLESP